MSETPPINVRLARALACIKADLVQVEFAGKALDDKDDEIELLREALAASEEREAGLRAEIERGDKIIDKRDAHVVMLCEKIAKKDAKIQRLESRGISDMQWELKEKDKRIEELEQLLDEADEWGM